MERRRPFPSKSDPIGEAFNYGFLNEKQYNLLKRLEETEGFVIRHKVDHFKDKKNNQCFTYSFKVTIEKTLGQDDFE